MGGSYAYWFHIAQCAENVSCCYSRGEGDVDGFALQDKTESLFCLCLLINGCNFHFGICPH